MENLCIFYSICHKSKTSFLKIRSFKEKKKSKEPKEVKKSMMEICH